MTKTTTQALLFEFSGGYRLHRANYNTVAATTLGIKTGHTRYGRYASRHARLFFPGGLAHSVGQIFANFLPVADGENPDKPALRSSS